MSRYALAFLANDRYLPWAMTFLESIRSKDTTLPIYCIPHRGPMTQIIGLQNAFGFEILEEGLERLDAFAQRLFPRHVRHRANLRKYAALTLPVDEVAYFDADTVMLVEPARMFGYIRPGDIDFLYLSTSPEWVYAAKKMQLAQSLFPDMRLMSAGAFVTSRNTLTIDDVIATVEQNFELYLSLRRPKVFDQPVLNFVLHRLGRQCRHIAELDGSLVGMASVRNPNLRATDRQIVDQAVPGDVLAIHWAGDAKSWLRRVSPQARSMLRFHESIRLNAVARLERSRFPLSHPLGYKTASI